MKKLLTEILEYLKTNSVNDCKCGNCETARSFIPRIEKELAKFGINEIVNIKLCLDIIIQDDRIQDTLNKVLEAIK
jgi:hypothetical protein